MAAENLEQSRQESSNLIQEEIDSMDVNTPLDNTIELLRDRKIIDIKEDFKETCNSIKNGSDEEKETIKSKLLEYLKHEGENIDFDKITIKVITDEDSGLEKIILTEQRNNYQLVPHKEYILKSEGGKRYYKSLSRKGNFPNEKEKTPSKWIPQHKDPLRI